MMALCNGTFTGSHHPCHYPARHYTVTAPPKCCTLSKATQHRLGIPACHFLFFFISVTRSQIPSFLIVRRWHLMIQTRPLSSDCSVNPASIPFGKQGIGGCHFASYAQLWRCITDDIQTSETSKGLSHYFLSIPSRSLSTTGHEYVCLSVPSSVCRLHIGLCGSHCFRQKAEHCIVTPTELIGQFEDWCGPWIDAVPVKVRYPATWTLSSSVVQLFFS